MKFFNGIGAFILLFTACSTVQSTTQENIPGAVKTMLDAKQFVFRANTAHPLGGGQIILNTEYDVILRNDSIICHLPYFGRAFSAPIGGEGGIRFVTSDFDYTISPVKRGNYVVTIQIKENIEVTTMSFRVSEGGYASLVVNSRNRQSISFNGNMMPIKR